MLDSSLEIEQAEILMPKPLPGTQIFKLPPRRVVILATPSAHSALRIARGLVLFLRRGAGQNQFSTALSFQGSSRIPLRELPVYVLEHLRDPLTVEGLANRVSISVRNFSRVFVKEFGVTPAAFIERLRIETAKRLVEESSRGLEEIATECGLGTLDTLTRAFLRQFGQTPAQLRKIANNSPH